MGKNNPIFSQWHPGHDPYAQRDNFDPSYYLHSSLIFVHLKQRSYSDAIIIRQKRLWFRQTRKSRRRLIPFLSLLLYFASFVELQRQCEQKIEAFREAGPAWPPGHKMSQHRFQLAKINPVSIKVSMEVCGGGTKKQVWRNLIC